MKKEFSKYRTDTKLIIALVLTTLPFAACKKHYDELALQDNISNNILPNVGPYSTLVNIYSSGFSSNIFNNKVKLNNTVAVVLSESATQLKVVVPKETGTGPETVQTSSKSSNDNIIDFTHSVTDSMVVSKNLLFHYAIIKTVIYQRYLNASYI